MIRTHERADDIVRDARRLWRPNPGKQEAFMRRREFEVGYGGAKGGGKSDAILWCSIQQARHPRYHGAIFRRNYPELQDLIDRGLLHFPKLGARWIPAKIGGSGKVKRSLHQGRVWGYKTVKYLNEAIAAHGLPPTFLERSPLTVAGKIMLVGNGVPLALGRAVAQAVRRALNGKPA